MTDLEKAFRLLGIPPSSDAASIRRAWRSLVRSYHPDMAKVDPKGANKRLAEINAAFDAVSCCTDADIKALRADIARRAKRAARAWKQDKNRSAASQSEPDGQDKSDASHSQNAVTLTPIRDRKASQNSAAVRRFPRRDTDSRTSRRAQQGFAEALKIFSGLYGASKRSTYY